MKVEFFDPDGTSLGVVDWDGNSDIEFTAPKPCVVAEFSVGGGPRLPIVVQMAARSLLVINRDTSLRLTSE